MAWACKAVAANSRAVREKKEQLDRAGRCAAFDWVVGRAAGLIHHADPFPFIMVNSSKQKSSDRNRPGGVAVPHARL